MNDEEVERLLRSLGATLVELGPPTSFAARYLLPKEERLTGTREQLRAVLDEYKALLVDAPRMMLHTMDLTDARSITFEADFEDARFGEGTVSERGPKEDLSSVTVTRERLGAWLEIAAEAEWVISELRGRLDD